MASATARLTGRPSACLAALGPGSTNLATGVAHAYLDRAPVIAITADTPEEKLPDHTHQALDLEGVAASAGAACHSGAISPSHVLTAMGRSPEQSRSSLRLSVGHGNDEAQIDRVVQLLAELIGPAREAFAT